MITYLDKEYTVVVPPYRPSVDRLQTPNTTADFQVPNMFFLGYICLPLPPIPPFFRQSRERWYWEGRLHFWKVNNTASSDLGTLLDSANYGQTILSRSTVQSMADDVKRVEHVKVKLSVSTIYCLCIGCTEGPLTLDLSILLNQVYL